MSLSCLKISVIACHLKPNKLLGNLDIYNEAPMYLSEFNCFFFHAFLNVQCTDILLFTTKPGALKILYHAIIFW